jgi:hypothetical protein
MKGRSQSSSIPTKRSKQNHFRKIAADALRELKSEAVQARLRRKEA